MASGSAISALVMIDHDQVEAGAPGLGQRLEGRHAAIDRDDDAGALLP